MRTRRVFVDSRWNIAYHVNLYRIIYGPDGVERERRDLNKVPGNVNAELPLRWSGRCVPETGSAAAIRLHCTTTSFAMWTAQRSTSSTTWPPSSTVPTRWR